MGAKPETPEDLCANEMITPTDSVVTNPYENIEDRQTLMASSISGDNGEYDYANYDPEYWTNLAYLVNTGDPYIDSGVV